MKFRVGTRGSKLALKQTEIFIQEFKKKFPDTEFEIVKIKTKGDKILSAPFSKIPGKGLFVKEIEEELIKENIDFAVHSLKDVPLDVPNGLSLSAFLPRDNPSDLLIGLTFEEIYRRKKIRIGTSSPRRSLIFREKFGDKVEIVPIRGNVDTRIRKLKEGFCDCIVIAYAGILRLGIDLGDTPFHLLDPKEFLYSPGQGIIAIETKEGTLANELAKSIDNRESRFFAEVERGILKKIGGGCSVPLGVCTEILEDKIFVKFRLFDRNFIRERYFDIKYMDNPERIIEKLFD